MAIFAVLRTEQTFKSSVLTVEALDEEEAREIAHEEIMSEAWVHVAEEPCDFSFVMTKLNTPQFTRKII